MATVNVKDLAITSLETISAFGINSGEYLFTLDELQDATISQSQDTQEITGKAGRKISTLKRNKAVTVSGTNGLVSGGLLELQTGGTFEDKTGNNLAKVRWAETLSVPANGTTVKTTYKAIGTAGAEIIALYKKDSDGLLSTKMSQDSTAAAGKFAYNATSGALTFDATDFAAATDIYVVYERNIAASVLDNPSDAYSEKCQMYIDAIAEDKCGNAYRVQFYIPKADFNGEFEFEMGGDQTVHAFEAEALSSGTCGGSANGFWTMTIFDDDYNTDKTASA